MDTDVSEVTSSVTTIGVVSLSVDGDMLDCGTNRLGGDNGWNCSDEMVGWMLVGSDEGANEPVMSSCSKPARELLGSSRSWR